MAGLAVGCVSCRGAVADKMTSVWLLTIALRTRHRFIEHVDADAAVCEKKIVGTVTGFRISAAPSADHRPVADRFIAHVTNSFALALA